MKPRKIAVIGNPNSGKTTLFNGLTGARQKTGNWAGVSVEKWSGSATMGKTEVEMVDLPGVYSFTSSSEDEVLARDYIMNRDYDLVLNIADATNFERNMFLTLHLIEMKVPMVLVLNMMDLAKQDGLSIDIDKLSSCLDLPVTGISAIDHNDILRLRGFLEGCLKLKRVSSFTVGYPESIERTIREFSLELKDMSDQTGVHVRWLATRIIEGDLWFTRKALLLGSLDREDVEPLLADIKVELEENPDVVVADSIYSRIEEITARCVNHQKRGRLSDRVDDLVMNRFAGIPIFLGLMFLVFWSVMSFGGSFIEFFEKLSGVLFIDGSAILLRSVEAPGPVVRIVSSGIGSGIQAVSSFIPVVFVMYFMLTLLENTGYMARAAFVMDRFMRFLGLPGKAFVPMILGLGCTIPGVLATRTLDSPRDRFMTVFMIPFMSCGAKLPVYALFAAAFFPAWRGAVVFSLYLAGTFLALSTGMVLKNTLFRGKISDFVMEIPPYRVPRLRHLLLVTWFRTKIFIIRAGTVIVIMVALLTFLNTPGAEDGSDMGGAGDSMLSQIGRMAVPIFEPMGISRENWPAAVSLFSGIFAKEAIIGSLNSLYIQGGEAAVLKGDDITEKVEEAFLSVPLHFEGILPGRSPMREAGAGTILPALREHFTEGPLQVYAYLLFVLLYFPCVASLSVIVRVAGPLIAVLSVLYMTFLAWVTATLFYQVTLGHQVIWIGVPLIVLAGMGILMSEAGKIYEQRRSL